MIKMTDLWANVQLPAEINHVQEIEYIMISLLNLKKAALAMIESQDILGL